MHTAVPGEDWHPRSRGCPVPMDTSCGPTSVGRWSRMSHHAVDRRAFLTLGAFGGVSLAAARGSAPTERSAVFAARTAPVAPFELEEVSIATLQERMTSGAETSRSITEKYLSRIAAMDREGPALRQVLETNPDALAIAAERDAERKAGRIRGPLHGIPILLKDNVG